MCRGTVTRGCSAFLPTAEGFWPMPVIHLTQGPAMMRTGHAVTYNPEEWIFTPLPQGWSPSTPLPVHLGMQMTQQPAKMLGPVFWEVQSTGLWGSGPPPFRIRHAAPHSNTPCYPFPFPPSARSSTGGRCDSATHGHMGPPLVPAPPPSSPTPLPAPRKRRLCNPVAWTEQRRASECSVKSSR